MTNMKKLMLTSALALCAPAAFAAPAAGKVSCTPEQTGVGGMVFKVGSVSFAGVGLCAVLAIVLNLLLPDRAAEEG